jgi:hypothetical protein
MARVFEGPQEAASVARAGVQRVVRDQAKVMELLGGELFATYVREGQEAWRADSLPQIYLQFSEDGMALVYIYEFEPTLTQETLDSENDPRYTKKRLTAHESDQLYGAAMAAMGWTA